MIAVRMITDPILLDRIRQGTPPNMTICLRASSLMERTNLSQWALRLGLRGGRTTASTLLSLSKPSNAWVNLVSRSWSRYRLPSRNPSKGSVSCRAHCCLEAAVGCGLELGTVRYDPPVDGRMLNRAHTLLHAFFHLAIAQGIGHVPPHAGQDDLFHKMGPLEADHRHSPSVDA
jgi:hypothetical protein